MPHASSRHVAQQSYATQKQDIHQHSACAALLANLGLPASAMHSLPVPLLLLIAASL